MTKQTKGSYWIDFEKELVGEEGEQISLTAIISPDIREVLKEVVVAETSKDMSISIGNSQVNFQRYLVKKLIYSEIREDYKDFLFSKDLIDNGKITFTFEELETAQMVQEKIRGSFYYVLKTILSCGVKTRTIFEKRE